MAMSVVKQLLVVDDDTRLVLVEGAVDTVTAPELNQTIDELVDSGVRHVVLDLSAVEFMDSSGLVVLVTAANRLRKLTGDLRVAAPSEQVQRLIGLTRMESVFGVYATRGEALGQQPAS